MGQPNLSRAIRELEEELGVDLFRRTSRGIVPTAQGEAFWSAPERCCARWRHWSRRLDRGAAKRPAFPLPRLSSGMPQVRLRFLAASLPPQQAASISYRETSVQGVVDFVAQGECRLGMVRYCAGRSRYFERLFAQRGHC